MSKIEEFGQSWSQELPRGQISFLVNKYHVSADADDVAQDIRDRAESSSALTWPAELVREAGHYAAAQHRANIKLYLLVMRG